MSASLNSEANIFFHVGTGKTGTTFLQYRVFPNFQGICYIQRTRYKKAKKIIRANKHDRYLVSREFDQQLEQEVKLFAKDFPDTIPIIVFRKHDSYIASQYRRFVKNGFTGSFREFFDLQNDTGYFKKKDLNYCEQIRILKAHFTPDPIVLFYEDLKKDPVGFIKQIAHQLVVSIDIQKINLSKKHTSYSEKQLKALLFVGRYINLKKRRIFKNNILHFLWRIYLGTLRYATLYLSKLIPGALFSPKPLINKDELVEINAYYNQDWNTCLKYGNA